MAKEYYGVDKGLHKEDVVLSSSTTSKGVELVVDLAKVSNKLEVEMAVEAIRIALTEQVWPA